MATIDFYNDNIKLKNGMSSLRATIMTSFFGNNVIEVGDVSSAYELAKNSPGTVELTGMPVFEPEKSGLPDGANQLLFNDGAVVGRCMAARKILGEPNCDLNVLLPVIREAVYKTRFRKLYKAQTIIGLDSDFMVKAHLLIPENFENTLYSWMLNFQYVNDEYRKLYENSLRMDESDIYVFSDPDWSHPEFPYGLTLFDPEHNCAVILGMRYFGEHKKGTLTLAWAIAARHGYACCHGGMKRYNLNNDKTFQIAVFGLSGSGKSTITHAKHNNKYNITILHDDAFIINTDRKFSIALEPSYFDKTIDYPLNHEDNKFILTHQNEGVIMLSDGKLYSVPEDIRNGNGRAVKSKLWSPVRVNRINEPLNAIFWLMKDPALPPVLKLLSPSLGAVMGACLATKRTVAERLAEGVDPNALVFEPYANPFRVYPLALDFTRYKKLFEDGVECYILNTGDYMDKKVQASDTLSVIEMIVENKAAFHKWENFSGIETMDIKGFDHTFSDQSYRNFFIERIKDRIDFVKSRETYLGGRDKLPPEAKEVLEHIIEECG